MSILGQKISAGQIAANGVVNAPDRLTGTAAQNKALFDRLIRDCVAGLYNTLIDTLAGAGGAGEIGFTPITDFAGSNVQDVIENLKALVDTKEGGSEASAALALKADKSETAAHIKAISFDAETGIFVFTRESGAEITINTALEKVATNWVYDAGTQSLVLTLADGSTQSVSLSAFITETEFADSDEIDFSVSNHVVTAHIKPGSLTDTMFDSDLMTLLENYAATASAAATTATGAATSAANSAQSAAGSAAAAALSEDAAGLSEANAADSETAAALSETNASASASSAASSATSAASSASSAAASEAAAGLSEANAASSEANAASSETNAAASETAASVSASAAAASETAAGLSETNAALSEVNASASETNAAASEEAAASSASDSEAWAVGKRGGADVPSTDETYHNNAKYWAQEAQRAAGGGVMSFNGRSGTVMPQSGDYTASDVGAAPAADLTAHTGDTNNPHEVTKAQVGLGNVPNVTTNNQTPTYTEASANAELVSGETLSTALGKIAKAIKSFIAHLSAVNPHGINKSTIGLENVDNTADANKNVSYAATAGSAPASDVSAWAKAASKPSYTATEVGAAASSHAHGNITSAGKIGSAADLAVVTGSGGAITTRGIKDNSSTSGTLGTNTYLMTERTLRYHSNRTTSAGAADTNYSTYMFRGESLNSSDTTPSYNGQIAWKYE